VRISPIIIPLSFLFSLLFSLGKFHRNNELTSMRTVGLNIFQNTMPLRIASAILSIVSLLFNMHLSSIVSQKTQDFCRDVKVHHVEHKLVFYNERNGRTWFIGELNRQTSSSNCIMVCLYDCTGNESGRMFAQTFSHRVGIWSFCNGFNTVFDKETHRPSMIVKFDELESVCDESPEFFLSIAKPVKYLSFTELRRILSFSGISRKFTRYRARLYCSVPFALSCLLITFITIPFSTIGVKQNPMIGVAKACAVLFVFYLSSNVCHIFGANRILPIFLATCLPYPAILLPAYPLYKTCI
jgi:lipopolysaccharide export system permease protein